MPNRSVPAAAPGLPKDTPETPDRLDLETMIDAVGHMTRIAANMWERTTTEIIRAKQAGWPCDPDSDVINANMWACYHAQNLAEDLRNAFYEGVTAGTIR